jgi:hypothetical protein
MYNSTSWYVYIQNLNIGIHIHRLYDFIEKIIESFQIDK